MDPDRRVQALIFIMWEKGPDSQNILSIAKACILLPHKLEIGPKVREVLLKHNVQILRSGGGLIPQLHRESYCVEIVEVLFDEADVLAKVQNESKLFLAYDRCNEKTVKLLFGRDFRFKSKFNFEHVRLVVDGSDDVLNVLERLLTFKANIRYASPKGGTLLHFAVERDHFDLLELLLKLKANVDAKNNDGATPLHLAAGKGSLKLACVLLQHGASVNAKTTANFPKNSTPLHFAANYQRIDVVKFLLEHGADSDATDSSGTVLLQAVEKRNVDLQMLILGYGPSADNHSNRRALDKILYGPAPAEKVIVEVLLQCGFTAAIGNKAPQDLMCCAVEKGFLQVVQQLIDGGVRPNSGYKIPPLHSAAQRGSVDMVRLLLDAGAGVNTKSSDKQTPLFFAIERRPWICSPGVNWRSGESVFDLNSSAKEAERIVNLLLENGARVDVKDWQGRTALHKAAANGNTKVIVKLVQLGADINAKCHQGKTPLAYALDEGWFDSEYYEDVIGHASPMTLKLYSRLLSDLFVTIVSNGADVNAKCNKGRTPLFYAVGRPRFFDIRDLLEQRQVEIDARDNEGKTPLHVAAENGLVIFIETLIHHGADVDARCAKGKSALMYAAGNDHFDAIVALLLHDAKIGIVDHSGRTALNGASQKILYYYCFTDPRCLKSSIEQIQKVKSDDYRYHVVRTKSAVPSTRWVQTPSFTVGHINYFEWGCESEVEKMKTFYVGNTDISLFDVLLYSSDQLASALKNDQVVKAFKQLNCKAEIPRYAEVVQMKFQHAYRRRKLMDRRSIVFKLFYPECLILPDELQEQIFSFLSNSDLMRLQMACTCTLARVNRNVSEQIKREPHPLLCCSSELPRTLKNEVDSFVSDLVDNTEHNAEPYWLHLTRMRL